MKRSWILVLGLVTLFAIITAALIYFFVYNKPQPDYFKATPDFELNSQDLFREFKENPSEASAKYNGKVIAVKGELSAVETTDSSTIGVFAIDEGMFGDEGLRFSFIPEHSGQLISTPPGSTIVIKGYCTGFNETDVIFEHCSIVN